MTEIPPPANLPAGLIAKVRLDWIEQGGEEQAEQSMILNVDDADVLPDALRQVTTVLEGLYQKLTGKPLHAQVVTSSNADDGGVIVSGASTPLQPEVHLEPGG